MNNNIKKVLLFSLLFCSVSEVSLALQEKYHITVKERMADGSERNKLLKVTNNIVFSEIIKKMDNNRIPSLKGQEPKLKFTTKNGKEITLTKGEGYGTMLLFGSSSIFDQGLTKSKTEGSAVVELILNDKYAPFSLKLDTKKRSEEISLDYNATTTTQEIEEYVKSKYRYSIVVHFLYNLRKHNIIGNL